MNEVVIAGVFTIIGACLGFVGTIIQSAISAKNNISIVKAQAESELQRHRYLQKEQLYIDIITFLPNLVDATDKETGKINISSVEKEMLDSFQARLFINSSTDIYNSFCQILNCILYESDSNECMKQIQEFDKSLIKDLKKIK